jgi:hypothetical protein
LHTLARQFNVSITEIKEEGFINFLTLLLSIFHRHLLADIRNVMIVMYGGNPRYFIRL